jgi:ribosome-associated translation inhibitor RaiA
LAIANYTKALDIQPESNEAIGLRAKAYAAKMKMKEAENDYNQAILLNDRNADNFVGRGYVYFRLGEYEKALSDYEKAITLNKEIINAYKGKAQCLEAKNQLPEAKKSLQQAIKLANKNKNYDGKILETLLANVEAKIFQTMREVNAPSISFTSGDNQKLQINVPKNALKVTVEGKITDESKIEKVLIGDFEAIFNKEQINPRFSVSLNLLMKDEVEVFVQDIYGNELKTYYKIVKTEKDAPKLTLSTPMVSEGKIINIADTNGFKLKVVGIVEDESSIKSIIINGKSASYNSKQNNPTFLIDIDIVGIDSLVIDVLDEFDNKASSVYTLLRGGNSNSSTNPMGKTWVVFIDNAKYSQLPMLEATSNDVLSMKLALESYNIEKIIVRNDMTKQQMEKFFAIELRDLVNGNNVNSIMIFYAGHGKFINESGYWMPVDANKKDEFTFFNVSTLKNYLGAYKPLTHSLVVSDACETGPAFYLAMRDANKIPQCGQWESARTKSAQFLTSTAIELNDDKSVFTKSFVNALKSCTDKCISIENIADKIAKQSVKYQNPKPKLGIIPALNNDDESTFFFVKK